MADIEKEDDDLGVVGAVTPGSQESDIEYVIEGSEQDKPELDGGSTDKDPLGGLTKEQIASQLKAMQDQLAAEKQLREAFSKAQAPSIVVQGPQEARNPEPTETPEQKQVRINKLFMENPFAAMSEMSKDVANPMLSVMIKNQEDFSREFLLKDAGEKAYYDKYKDEVEAEVKKMTPAEKLQNARVYQTALSRVKSAHSDDILQDLVAQKVTETLKTMGIDPTKIEKQPAVSTLAGKPTTTAPTGAKKTTVRIPQWVHEMADRQGVSDGIMYELLKSKGQLR